MLSIFRFFRQRRLRLTAPACVPGCVCGQDKTLMKIQDGLKTIADRFTLGALPKADIVLLMREARLPID